MLDQVLAIRRPETEPVVLVNGDITPENFIARRSKFAGLIDPVPVLHNGLRYAFLFCVLLSVPSAQPARCAPLRPAPV